MRLNNGFVRTEICRPEARLGDYIVRVQVSFIWISGVIVEGPSNQIALRLF